MLLHLQLPNILKKLFELIILNWIDQMFKLSGWGINLNTNQQNSWQLSTTKSNLPWLNHIYVCSHLIFPMFWLSEGYRPKRRVGSNEEKLSSSRYHWTDSNGLKHSRLFSHAQRARKLWPSETNFALIT